MSQTTQPQTISVIIPTLNRYNLLGPIVEGLFAWPTKPHEVILVDQTRHLRGDGDYPDYTDPDRGIRHLQVGFAGPCIARNTGAAQATGDLLLFLDDDLRLDPARDLLAYALAHMEAHPQSVLVGRFDDSPTSDDPVMSGRFDVMRYITRGIHVFPSEYRASLGLNAGIFCMPREIFETVGGFDEGFDPDGALEDRELGLRCFYAGYMLFYSTEFLVEHLGRKTGGRREQSVAEKKLARNKYYYWSKYMDEENYYVQCFGDWLTTGGRTKPLLKRLIRWLLLSYYKVPEYHSVRRRDR